MQSTWAEEQLKPNLRRYHANGWRITGYDWSTGFQRDSQSSGSIAQFDCSTTNFPRLRSFMPVGTYYSSFSTTSAIVLSTTAPAKKSAIILGSSILVPTSDYNSYPTEEKISRLPSSAKARIGGGTGLVALAIIAVIAISLRQRRKRAHAFPTDGGTEPAIA